MRKRSSKFGFTRDVNVMASRIVQSIADLDIGKKNPAAVALGRMGGLKGGRARAAKLTKERRTEIASLAAKTRWSKRKED
jgi:hypothetical protein